MKINKLDIAQNQKIEKPLDEWYVNHFILDRKGYFIITESKSLYSKVVPSVGISNRKIFEEMVKELFLEIENDYLLSTNKISTDYILINKTNNRSIVGSQNELIRMAEAIYYYDDVENRDLTKINETPMMYTKSYPNKDIIEEVRKRKIF